MPPVPDVDEHEFRGEMKEFKRLALEFMTEIRADVKALNQFKWRVAGGSAVLAILLSVSLEAIHVILGH
jgi:hypothetical protein